MRQAGRRVHELTAEEREIFTRFCEAFERYDVPAVVEVMTEQATWQMPPFDRYYVGQEAIAALIGTQCPASGPLDLRMVPTCADRVAAARAREPGLDLRMIHTGRRQVRLVGRHGLSVREPGPQRRRGGHRRRGLLRRGGLRPRWPARPTDHTTGVTGSPTGPPAAACRVLHHPCSGT